jgi:hypothetical protein
MSVNAVTDTEWRPGFETRNRNDRRDADYQGIRTILPQIARLGARRRVPDSGAATGP